MNHDERRKVALWRYAILGPLVSADLDYGDRLRLFKEASARLYEHPCGRSTRRSARTIEGWYYAYRREGLRGLEPRTRKDAGATRVIDDELAALIIRAKRERPQRTIRQVIKILVRARRVRPGELHPATVHRLLRRAGVPTRRVRDDDDAGRLHARERRSFITRHAGDLWIGDFMHGPHVESGGRRRKALLVSILDCATRYILASTFVLAEDAVQHEAFLKRVLKIHGRPRQYYVDGGSPYRADSLGSICADLARRRRALRSGDVLPSTPSGLDPIGDLVREHRRASTPELPEIEIEIEDDDDEVEIEIEDDDEPKREGDEEERR